MHAMKKTGILFPLLSMLTLTTLTISILVTANSMTFFIIQYGFNKKKKTPHPHPQRRTKEAYPQQGKWVAMIDSLAQMFLIQEITLCVQFAEQRIPALTKLQKCTTTRVLNAFTIIMYRQILKECSQNSQRIISMDTTTSATKLQISRHMRDFRSFSSALT